MIATQHTEVDSVQGSHFTAKGLHDQGCHGISDMAGSLLAPIPYMENNIRGSIPIDYLFR